MIPKFVAIKQSYIGCPVHDGEGTPSLEFFNSLDEYIEYVKDNWDEYYLHELIDLDTRAEVMDNLCSYENHSIKDIKIENYMTDESFKLVRDENNKGKLKRDKQ